MLGRAQLVPEVSVSACLMRSCPFVNDGGVFGPDLIRTAALIASAGADLPVRQTAMWVRRRCKSSTRRCGRGRQSQQTPVHAAKPRPEQRPGCHEGADEYNLDRYRRSHGGRPCGPDPPASAQAMQILRTGRRQGRRAICSHCAVADRKPDAAAGVLASFRLWTMTPSFVTLLTVLATCRAWKRSL